MARRTSSSTGSRCAARFAERFKLTIEAGSSERSDQEGHQDENVYAEVMKSWQAGAEHKLQPPRSNLQAPSRSMTTQKTWLLVWDGKVTSTSSVTLSICSRHEHDGKRV